MSEHIATVLMPIRTAQVTRRQNAGSTDFQTLPGGGHSGMIPLNFNDMAMDGVDVGAWLAVGFEENDSRRSQEQGDPPFDETAGVGDVLSLCYTCLDEDRETVANGEYNGIMYCSKHLPAYPQLSQEEIVERFKQEVARFFNGYMVHCDPPGYTLSEHIKALELGRTEGDGRGNHQKD